jgi:hypothetical protein
MIPAADKGASSIETLRSAQGDKRGFAILSGAKSHQPGFVILSEAKNLIYLKAF